MARGSTQARRKPASRPRAAASPTPVEIDAAREQLLEIVAELVRDGADTEGLVAWAVAAAEKQELAD